MTEAAILILEDDLALIRLYGKVIRKAGYKVSEATNIQEARDQLSRQRFDVFICDMRLGAERGIDLLIEQKMFLEEQQTQVVVVSAEEQYREMCREMGIDLFFSKPVSPSELARMIERLLNSNDKNR